VSAKAIGVACAEEKAFASWLGKIHMAATGALRKTCVSFPGAVGVTGAGSEDSVDLAAQHGICAQQSVCWLDTVLQQAGKDTAAGAICASTSNKPNQMLISCFTNLRIC
jgi:hypothetical protein